MCVYVCVVSSLCHEFFVGFFFLRFFFVIFFLFAVYVLNMHFDLFHLNKSVSIRVARRTTVSELTFGPDTISS